MFFPFHEERLQWMEAVLASSAAFWGSEAKPYSLSNHDKARLCWLVSMNKSYAAFVCCCKGCILYMDPTKTWFELAVSI